MKKIKLFLSVAVVTFMFAACSKDGDTGPTGPQGPAGTQGPAGPQGPIGQTGTANVKSFTFTNAQTLTWSGNVVKSITFNYGGNFTISDAERNEGVVLTYIRFTSNTSAWLLLPNFDGITNKFLRPLVQTTSVAIQTLNEDFTFYGGVLNANQNPNAVKIVVIPAGTSTTIGKVALPDYNNYEETMKYYGLPIN